MMGGDEQADLVDLAAFTLEELMQLPSAVLAGPLRRVVLEASGDAVHPGFQSSI